METQKPTEKELLDRLLDQPVKDYKKPEDNSGRTGFAEAAFQSRSGASRT
jgi:hypothetical protein